MPESWGGREKRRKLQGSGLLEAVSGGESSHRVRKDGETRGPSSRLQRGGLGWRSLHSPRWSLDGRGPGAWKPARERSRAITHHSAGWGARCHPHRDLRSAAASHSHTPRRKPGRRGKATQDGRKRLPQDFECLKRLGVHRPLLLALSPQNACRLIHTVSLTPLQVVQTLLPTPTPPKAHLRIF